MGRLLFQIGLQLIRYLYALGKFAHLGGCGRTRFIHHTPLESRKWC
jgi:hypothetical protein